MLAFLLRLFGLLLVVALFAVVVVIGIVLIRRNRELVRSGIPVRSTVVHVRTQSVDSSFVYHPTVRYELHGRMWESTPSLGRHALKTKGFWKTSWSGEQFIGMPLDVLVDPMNPVASTVPGQSRLGILLVVVGSVFGGLVLLFGLLGVLIGIVR
ncbi:DUF3592 domain-containing protein [Brevibacterium yomogidense]|uniref:DUF3592 domain-containing protein n=1 Tax=Brevibacterium yomogidense TaxID=946573 RepID=A0A1X6X9P6_9MICO|nr:DUF3592 domain-containing protein [Brevibacterium yomogidense]SLM95859.1 hypothetical protein FM105_05120 [Brevibacterium yomogidense]